MYAIAFQAKIKNGNIEIPEEYQRRLREQGGDNSEGLLYFRPDFLRPGKHSAWGVSQALYYDQNHLSISVDLSLAQLHHGDSPSS